MEMYSAGLAAGSLDGVGIRGLGLGTGCSRALAGLGRHVSARLSLSTVARCFTTRPFFPTRKSDIGVAVSPPTCKPIYP